MSGLHELVQGHDGMYVTQRNADGTYELYRARLEHVEHFRRKWQAVKHAHGDQPSIVGGAS